MHPNNPFNKDYNFDELIEVFPSLEHFVFINKYNNKTIHYADNQAVKALNTAILKKFFGLEYWNFPEDNLCPPIPGRLDYLLHISDMFPEKNLHLLDIGTGANLIYPILSTLHFNWKVTASEVNIDSLKNAQEIINHNSSLSCIELRHQRFKNHILEHLIIPGDNFDVLICNPPFYKTRTDAEKSNLRKVKNLGISIENIQNFGGVSNELWYKGGEVGFIKKLAEESVKFKDQVTWFSSIVSQKDNLKDIKRAINKIKPSQLKVVEMEQGNKQSRFVAWTFQE